MTSEPRIVTGEGVDPIEIAEHNCFACGSLNRDGLQMTIHVERSGAWSELVLEPRFEGWEGVAHGGILATLLDEIMGWTLAAGDTWGVTARLAVDYRKPVVVGTALRVEGTIVRHRRRLVETAGRIVDQATGVEYAAAEATYVALDRARQRELEERYGIRRGNALSAASVAIPATDPPELVAR